MKNKSITIALALLALSTLNAQLLTAFAQGSLTPPDAPAPTMKTLDQIEARTPIDATHTPGDGTNQFIISAPGSYYLTGNITGVSGENGISINADDVTVDLNGFVLIGAANSLNGINVPSAQQNLRLHNGSAHGWGATGINCATASNSQFDHLRVSQNQVGLQCGPFNVLNDCSAEANSLDGISSESGCLLAACQAANNIGGNGIYAGNFCTITASTVYHNLNGINVQSGSTIIGCSATYNSNHGIYPASSCTIKDCTAASNGNVGIDAASGNDVVIVNCSASANSGGGIKCGNSGIITGCTASDNGTADGIAFANDCLISGNNASGNFVGIHTRGSLNRIDGNTANHNGHDGILWNNDYVVRNTAFANTSVNYYPDVGTGNTGPLSAASSTTSPWANF